MYVYLVRHAIAFDPDPSAWPDDRDRPLTPEGERKFRRTARGIMKLVPKVDVVLSSPLTRAWQTAQILHEHAFWPAPSRFEQLEPGRSPAEVMAALEPHAGASALALVGHEPSLHELASFLLTADPSSVDLTMRKGGAACLTFPETAHPGRGALDWFLRPGQLRALV